MRPKTLPRRRKSKAAHILGYNVANKGFRYGVPAFHHVNGGSCLVGTPKAVGNQRQFLATPPCFVLSRQCQLPATSFTFYEVVTPKRFQRAADRGSLCVNCHSELRNGSDWSLLQAE